MKFSCSSTFISTCALYDILFYNSFTFILPSTSISFLIFGSFFTFASIFNAILLLPIFFFITSVKGDFPRKHFAPFLSLLSCSANLLFTSVVMPVYNLPYLHRITYKNQSFIFVSACFSVDIRIGFPFPDFAVGAQSNDGRGFGRVKQALFYSYYFNEYFIFLFLSTLSDKSSPFYPYLISTPPPPEWYTGSS